MRRVVLSILLLAPGCSRGNEECEKRCAKLGSEPAMCREVCTMSCAEMEREFGVDEATCRELKAPASPTPSSS